MSHGRNPTDNPVAQDFGRRDYGGAIDEYGFTDNLPSHGNAPGMQLLSERITARRNTALVDRARGILGQGLENLQTYRPGGAAALMSPFYSQMANMELQDRREAPDLMHNYRQNAAAIAAKASRRAGYMALAGQVIGAVGSVVAASVGGGKGAGAAPSTLQTAITAGAQVGSAALTAQGLPAGGKDAYGQPVSAGANEPSKPGSSGPGPAGQPAAAVGLARPQVGPGGQVSPTSGQPSPQGQPSPPAPGATSAPGVPGAPGAPGAPGSPSGGQGAAGQSITRVGGQDAGVSLGAAGQGGGGPGTAQPAQAGLYNVPGLQDFHITGMAAELIEEDDERYGLDLITALRASRARITQLLETG